MSNESQSTCEHEWIIVKECPAGCDVPLALSVEDLNGGFCYDGDPAACNYSESVVKCCKCGCNQS